MVTLHDGTDATVLAESNGYQVLQAGDQVYVVDRGWGWVSTASFVFALIALIFTIAPVVLAFATGVPLLGLGVLVGLGAAGAIVLLRGSREKKRAQPVDARSVLLVIDVGGGQVREVGGQSLCELRELQIGRRMQIGSSSKALQATWPAGKRVIARGTPFGGDVGPIEATLRRFVT